MIAPVDHPVLDSVFGLLKRIPHVRDVSRESECVEFFDPDDEQCYEIVVRPLDGPSTREAAEAAL